MEGQEKLLRAYGLREIGAGVVSLSVDEEKGLWMRVAGDAIDILTLIAALRRRRRTGRIVAALSTVLAVTAADVFVASRLTRSERST